MDDRGGLSVELERDTDMPVRMTSEKFIRAERRNQVETQLLGVHFKHIDRATVRLNYEVDREKRVITKSFKNVVKTSGISDAGIPPKNDKDTDYVKCPTYRQGLKLSNKRLLEWRECEKQLNKFISHHENEMLKHVAARRRVVKGLEPEPEENGDLKRDEERDDDDDVFLESESVHSESSPKTSPVDMLKDNPDNTDEVFDIKKWQKEIVESYTSMIRRHGVTGSVSESDISKTKGKLKSKSSPTFSSHTKDNDVTDQTRVRPHTANAALRLRPSSAKSIKTRPSSATSLRSRPSSAKTPDTENASPFLITRDSIYIKTGQKFKKFIDTRPAEQPVLINNYIDSTGPAESGPLAVNGLCPVEEGDEDEPEDEGDNKPAEITHTNKPETSHNGLKPFHGRHKSKRQRTTSVGTSSLASTRQGTFKHSNSDLSSYVESHRRKRRDSDAASSSIFSRPLSRAGSSISVHRPSMSLGIPADIDEISRGQDKLANEVTAEKPLNTHKLVQVSAIVKAAMTFSRLARTRALQQMQDENSSDEHEIIRQERLRKLQSRQNVLNSIANQWNSDSPDVLEQVE